MALFPRYRSSIIAPKPLVPSHKAPGFIFQRVRALIFTQALNRGGTALVERYSCASGKKPIAIQLRGYIDSAQKICVEVYLAITHFVYLASLSKNIFYCHALPE